MNLYYRHGAEFTGQPQLDKKNKPFTTVVDKCTRCGGAGGAEKWRHTGWTCYRCGGKGLEAPRAVKLYTHHGSIFLARPLTSAGESAIKTRR